MKSPTWNSIPRVSKKRLKSLGGHLPGSTIPPTRKVVKKRNAGRRVSEFARAYGSRARVQFVKQYACLVGDAYCIGEPIDNAHTIGGGMGRKADATTIVPLCRYHHRELHRHGVGTFVAVHRIEFAAAAARVERDWQKFQLSAAGHG